VQDQGSWCDWSQGQSCDTTRQSEAHAFAINLYDELYIHVKQGGSIKAAPSFQAVYDEWIKFELRKEITDRVAVYALPFFAKDTFNKIGKARLTDFWLHRQSTFKRKRSSNGTLLREKTAMANMWRYAKAKGYITETPDLNPLEITSPNKRRSTFTAKEWQKVLDSIPAWVAEDGVATTRDRIVAANHFIILANTGIRVGEARGLKWADVRRDGNHVIFEVTGKTGTREVVCLKGTDAALDRIKRFTGNHVYVFAHPDGSQIGSFKTAWAALLKHARVPQRDRSIYALRHFFITGRLQNGVNVYLIAKQCGTSVELIERHYGHLVHSEMADHITRTQIVEGIGADLTEFLEY
jgi:integrase